jgi:hypothetical protein
MAMLSDVLVSLFVALVLTAVLAPGSRGGARWARTTLFFSAVFLAAWAGGAWLSMRGALPRAAQVLSFILVGGVMAALLSGGLLGGVAGRGRDAAARGGAGGLKTAPPREPAAVFGLALWILLILLGLSIAARYI